VSLSILNNVSALTAENSLNMVSAMQQKTDQQLSTGLRVNSSADDSAGLSIATGMQANIAALVQSENNANNGIGFLQVADGALSQVGGLLNRAVTLATEAASGGLTSQQRGSANTEYQSILSEINQIGAATEFNGTQVFTNGNTSPASLTSGGTAIAGTIDPADTLTGGFDVTSTIPGASGATRDVTLTDTGTSTSGTITPGAALSGNLTVTSTAPGSPDPITFTANSDGSTITSSQITAGSTLSGNLVIDSTGGNASDSDTINLANYQGLASSDSATATAAANQLAADLTTAMEATTGSTYTASIGGGVLSITTSNPPTVNTSPISTPFQPEGWWIQGTAGLYAGETLAGSLTFTSNLGGAAETIDFANYQGLTSSNLATQNAALAALSSALNSTLGVSTGSTYTAENQNNELCILSNRTFESFQITSQSVTQTPTAGAQNIDLTSDGGSLYTINSAPAGATLSGMLKLSATGPDGSGSISIDMSNYSDILGGDANATLELQALQTAINNTLGSAIGETYYLNADQSFGIFLDVILARAPSPTTAAPCNTPCL